MLHTVSGAHCHQSCCIKGTVTSQAGALTAFSLWWYFLAVYSAPSHELAQHGILLLSIILEYDPVLFCMLSSVLVWPVLFCSSCLPATRHDKTAALTRVSNLCMVTPQKVFNAIRLAQYTQPVGLACRIVRSSWRLRSRLTLRPLRLSWRPASLPPLCSQTWKQRSRSWLTECFPAPQLLRRQQAFKLSWKWSKALFAPLKASWKQPANMWQLSSTGIRQQFHSPLAHCR